MITKDGCIEEMKTLDDMKKVWYSTLIYESLKANLPVSLFIAEHGELGVKIDDIEFPFFAWEIFEEQTELDDEIEKAEIVNRKIIDTKLNLNP